MIYALSVGAMTFVATVLAGRPLVWLLRQRKVGKEINPDGPASHLAKAGTPTMGGLLIIAAVVIFTAAANLAGRHSIGLPLLVMASLAALGFLDDLGSLQGRAPSAGLPAGQAGSGRGPSAWLRAGLNKRLKFAALMVVGLGAAFGLYSFLDLRAVNIPYAGRFDIGPWYVPITVGIIVLTTGAVAVSDGLDGLTAGTSAIAFLAYAIIALWQEQTYLAVFCFTAAAAALGFLWYNSHPAQVFMGDTGALALGGGLAVVAFMSGHWLLLPVIGVIFLVEGLSDVIQVGYFRLTGGKRVFKMSPLHHHFELVGWSEPQVVQRFWLVAALGAVVGVILAMEV